MNSESWRNSLDALVEFMCAPTDGAAAELARLREERDREAERFAKKEAEFVEILFNKTAKYDSLRALAADLKGALEDELTFLLSIEREGSCHGLPACPACYGRWFGDTYVAHKKGCAWKARFDAVQAALTRAKEAWL